MFSDLIRCESVVSVIEQDHGFPAVENDFEEAVFRQYPQLKSLKRKLLRLGADPVMMTGMLAGPVHRQRLARSIRLHFIQAPVLAVSLR